MFPEYSPNLLFQARFRGDEHSNLESVSLNLLNSPLFLILEEYFPSLLGEDLSWQRRRVLQPVEWANFPP